MTKKPVARRSRATKTRSPLSRDRVIGCAVSLADKEGLDAVTMRRVATKLHVEAMSLYHHVKSKEQLLDGMVDVVFQEVELPGEVDWRWAMRRRAASLRDALLRHRWAVGLLDSRASPGPATLRHHDAVIGCLRRAGFSIPMTAHVFSLLDSYIYGFVLQEVNLPFDSTQSVEEMAGGMLAAMSADEYPHFMELAEKHAMRPDYAFAHEFEWGLEQILDAVERLQGASAGS